MGNCHVSKPGARIPIASLRLRGQLPHVWIVRVIVRDGMLLVSEDFVHVAHMQELGALCFAIVVGKVKRTQ